MSSLIKIALKIVFTAFVLYPAIVVLVAPAGPAEGALAAFWSGDLGATIRHLAALFNEGNDFLVEALESATNLLADIGQFLYDLPYAQIANTSQKLANNLMLTLYHLRNLLSTAFGKDTTNIIFITASICFAWTLWSTVYVIFCLLRKFIKTGCWLLFTPFRIALSLPM